jgi:hypothetical protein
LRESIEKGVRVMRWVTKRLRYFVGMTALALLMLIASGAQAELLTFDFNALHAGDVDAAISVYMSTLFNDRTGALGTSVTTAGAVVGVEHGFGLDPYIGVGADGLFEIHFNDPRHTIRGAQFEGHVFNAPPGPTFFFQAYSGNMLVTEYRSYVGSEGTFDSPFFPFTLPYVDRLVFSDSGSYDVAIDNLAVIPNPEPSTLLLMGGGLVGLGWVVRRRRQA